MHVISRDSPCYYLTSVPAHRLPVFRKDELKVVTCKALDEARKSAEFAIYAYVIMPDHFHVITDSARKSADTLRLINGIVGRRIIDYLKEQGHEQSLEKLRHETKQRSYRYSVFDHHPNVRVLMTEKMLMERVHYTHQNPVRAGLVERAEDYRWSSVRCWNGTMIEDEPLLMDLDRITWRSS
ncbi:MAG TPA: transposase [Pyrinomonadaceae bacterium]|nr:transposase [Pyrinomonadaceae bacterium]